MTPLMHNLPTLLPTHLSDIFPDTVVAASTPEACCTMCHLTPGAPARPQSLALEAVLLRMPSWRFAH